MGVPSQEWVLSWAPGTVRPTAAGFHPWSLAWGSCGSCRVARGCTGTPLGSQPAHFHQPHLILQ